MRSITLFWKEISPEYRNGPEFYYSIRYESLEKRKSRAINQLEKPDDSDIRCHNTTYTFIHMKSDVAYEFTIVGVNSIGESLNSSRILVERNDMIPHKPSNIEIYSFGGGRYEIHWTKPRLNSMSGSIVNYTVFWCQNLRPRPFPCEGPIDWYSTVNTSIALELPDIRTNYQFAVSANTLSTSSGMSWGECIVPIDGRLDKLSEVRLKVHNSTSIVVNWKLDCPAQKRVVEGYKIKFCRIDDSVKTNCEKTESVEVDNSVENYTLSNLDPFTKYRVTVLAFSDSGPSEESDPRFETTFHGSPEDAPSGLIVTQKTEDSLSLMWRHPIKPNGHISHFNVECDGKIYTQSSSNCNESVCFYTIEHLEPYHSYQIRVRACNNEALCSPDSHLLNATTSSSVPMPMDPPRSEVINSTTVRISWSPPVESNGPIDYFFIKLIRFDNSTEIFNISGKTREYFLTIDCDSIEDSSASYRSQYSVQISSSNILETGVSPLAEYSESTNLNACLLMPPPDMAYIIGLITGGALGLVVLVLVLVTLVRWMKNKINSYRHLQIELPKGLEIPVLVTNPGPNDSQPFDPFNRSDSYLNVGIIDDNDSIINKNRHGSGLSHTSNSSTEFFYNKTSNKGKENFFRMPSSESGQPGSVSSTEAHMSSDSGVENDNQLQNKELMEILIQNKNNPKSAVDDNSRNSDSSDSKDSGILDTNSGKIRNLKKKRNPKTIAKISPKISSIIQSNAVTNPLYDTPMSHSVCIYSLLANSEPSLFEVGFPKDDNISNDLTKYSKPFLAKSLTDIIQCYSPSDPKVNCIICETNATSSRNSSRTSTPICPYYKYGIKRQNHNQNNHLVNVSPAKKEDVKATKPYVQLDSILQNGQPVPTKSSKKKLEHDWSQNSYDAEVSSTSSNGDNEQTDGIFNQNNCLSKSSQSFTDCQKIQNKIQNNPSIEDNTELIDIDSPVNPLNTSSNDLVIEFDSQLDAIKDLNQTNDRTLEVKASPTHLVKDSNGYVLHNTLNHLSANQTKPNLIKNSNGYVVIDAMGPGFDGIEMTDYVPNASVVNNVTQV